MNSLQELFIKQIDHMSSTDHDFVNHVLNVFPVQTLCDMMKINRNRYYYLKHKGLLEQEILKLRGETK